MTPILLCLDPQDDLATDLARLGQAEQIAVEHRRFPDGETYLRLGAELTDRPVAILTRMSPPDPDLFALLALVDTARDLGAESVGLIAPYLPYMRQDTRFQKGEAITSRTFSDLVNHRFDWLVTVDPHLHRYRTLNQIYTLPHAVCQSAPSIAHWIRDHVERPLLIGPDEESGQWVSAVAEAVPAPSLVLEKVRHGDREVSIVVPDVDRWRDHTPVLVDDIIATAGTQAETLGHLAAAGLQSAVCIGVHAVFAERAVQRLESAGAARIVTANTLAHPSNAIDLTPLLVAAIRENGFWGQRGSPP